MSDRAAAADAAFAIEGFILAIRQARDMVSRSEANPDVDALLSRAAELLDVVDETLLELDFEKHRELFESVPGLRAKLAQLSADVHSRR